MILIFSIVSSINGQELVDESNCTAPEGYLCGSKVGLKTEFIYPPGSLDQAFAPIALAVNCCVKANKATACNAAKVGCSTVKEK